MFLVGGDGPSGSISFSTDSNVTLPEKSSTIFKLYFKESDSNKMRGTYFASSLFFTLACGLTFKTTLFGLKGDPEKHIFYAIPTIAPLNYSLNISKE